MIHPDLRTLEHFAALALSRDAMIEIGRHVASCGVCRTRIRREVEGGAHLLARLTTSWPESSSEDYDSLFLRIEGRAAERLLAVRRERHLVQELDDELHRLPPQSRRAQAAADERFHIPALAERLLERCRGSWGEDRQLARDEAELALTIIDRLKGVSYGTGLQHDLQARGWAFLANVHRLSYEFAASHDAFAKAEHCLEVGSGDPLEQAQVLVLKSALLRAQRRMDDALKAVHQAIRIYRRTGDHHLQGSALVSEAMIHGFAADIEHSIELLCEAIPLLDSAREPRIAYVARHNLLKDFISVGRLAEAEAALPGLRQMVAEVGTREDRLRLLWVEGELQAALGQYSEAAEIFLRVREEFLSQGVGYDTALVSLDLAQVYLQQGLLADVKQTAVAMHAIFETHELHREALAALIMFQRAAEHETVSVHLIQEVKRFLNRSHGEYQLHSERPS